MTIRSWWALLAAALLAGGLLALTLTLGAREIQPNDGNHDHGPPGPECGRDLVAQAKRGGGVHLAWTGHSDSWRIHRAVGDGPLALLVEIDGNQHEYFDPTTQEGVTYRYTIHGVVGDQETFGCDIATVLAIPELPTIAAAAVAVVGGVAAYTWVRRR